MLPQLHSSIPSKSGRPGSILSENNGFRSLNSSRNTGYLSKSLPQLQRSRRNKGAGRYRSVGLVDVDTIFSGNEDDDCSVLTRQSEVSHNSIIRPNTMHLSTKKIPDRNLYLMLDELEKIGSDTLGGTGLNIGIDGMAFLSEVSSDNSKLQNRRLSTHGTQLTTTSILEMELRYFEMKEKERSSGSSPTRFKAAVVGDLLQRLVPLVGEYSHVLKPLVDELLNCIFADFAESMTSQIHIDNYATWLATMCPYFERCDLVTLELEDTKIELDAINRGYKMKDIVKKFQTVRLAFQTLEIFLRDASFRLWKRFCQLRRHRQNVARLRSIRYRWKRWIAFHRFKKQLEEEELDQVVEEKLRLFTLGNAHELSRTGDVMSNTPSDNERVEIGEGITFSDERNADNLPTITHAELTTQSISTDIYNGVVNSPRLLKPTTKDAETSLSREHNSQCATAPSSLNHSVIFQPTSHISIEASSIQNSPRIESIANDDKNDTHPTQIIRQRTFMHNQKMNKASWLGIHTVATQTPDSWVDEYADQRKVQRALSSIQNLTVVDTVALTETVSTGRSSNMSISAAKQLIAFIYERKWCDVQQNNNWVKSFEDFSLLQYSHLALLNRYHHIDVSTRLFHDLLAVCQEHGYQDKRLLVFGRLCGLKMVKEDHYVAHNDIREGFFFRMLQVLFHNRLELLLNSFASEMIPRDDILDMVAEIFPNVERHEAAYDKLISDIIDLPNLLVAKHQAQGHHLAMSNIDDVLLLLMGYYQLELSHNPTALLHHVGIW